MVSKPQLIATAPPFGQSYLNKPSKTAKTQDRQSFKVVAPINGKTTPMWPYVSLASGVDGYYLKHDIVAITHNGDDTSYHVKQTKKSWLTNDFDRNTATWLFDEASKCPEFP